ncbi:MAG: hypothetical protein AB1797_10855 [bacterium]
MEEIDSSKAWPVYKILGDKCVKLGFYEDAVKAYKIYRQRFPK